MIEITNETEPEGRITSWKTNVASIRQSVTKIKSKLSREHDK